MVELLVTIGIIAVLIALLLPILRKARASSQSISCISNLRQLMFAFNLYAGENKQFLPDPAADRQSWEGHLRKYLPSREPFRCQSDGGLYDQVKSSYDWRDTGDPRTTLAGKTLLDIHRSSAVFVFDALPDWHGKGMINIAQADGSTRAVTYDDCQKDLETPLNQPRNTIMRILVAEDHASLARSIADGLRDDGYAVDLTFDGNEALHLAATNPYDAIILDLMLPGKDGFSIVQTLRRRDIQSPILILTARDGVNDRVKGLDLGADDYLVKPFAWEELSARVRSMVRRGHGKKSANMTVGDLEIDSAKKLARRGGKTIDLSAREYALLEYLAHRAGQVVTRSDIWEHLYDQHDENTSNVVDVYIGYLRNKIDKEFAIKLIHTRRGQGYLLGVET